MSAPKKAAKKKMMLEEAVTLSEAVTRACNELAQMLAMLRRHGVTKSESESLHADAISLMRRVGEFERRAEARRDNVIDFAKACAAMKKGAA